MGQEVNCKKARFECVSCGAVEFAILRILDHRKRVAFFEDQREDVTKLCQYNETAISTLESVVLMRCDETMDSVDERQSPRLKHRVLLASRSMW